MLRSFAFKHRKPRIDPRPDHHVTSAKCSNSTHELGAFELSGGIRKRCRNLCFLIRTLVKHGFIVAERCSNVPWNRLKDCSARINVAGNGVVPVTHLGSGCKSRWTKQL